MFEILPVEIITHILRFLDNESLYRVSQAYTRVQEICKHSRSLRYRFYEMKRAKQSFNIKIANKRAKMHKALDSQVKLKNTHSAVKIQAAVVPLGSNVMKKYLKDLQNN